MRIAMKTAFPAPLLILGIALCVMTQASSALAGDDKSAIRLSPGRVSFAMKANGEWAGFGVRGERALLDHGGVVLFAGTPESAVLDERVSAAHGGMRSVATTGERESLFEGEPGGARYPSAQPDDDNDGRVDEDPWDGQDNDADGATDEDFAAIGDEMAVAVYGSRGDASITVRQECYGWSLAHIDGMVASTVVVTNTGSRTVPHVHIGIEFEAASDLRLGEGLVIEGSRRTNDIDAAFVERHVVFEDGDRGLAALLLVPRAAVSLSARPGVPVAWNVRDDHDRVTAVSPDLGDLAPGASATVYVALLALPADDLKAARAIRNAHRTIVGDGASRFIPPPVSLMARGEEGGTPNAAGRNLGGHALDPFWTTAGKLQETLLTGSPNPFRDAVNIDYEIPSRAVDEDGVEHVLAGSPQPTSVKVYNVAGRLVATLVDQPHTPGKYRTDWVARTDEGASLASGVYYVKLQIARRSVTMRMVQLK